MAIRAHGLLMVHGGVLPQWDVTQTLPLAAEVEAVLRGPGLVDFLSQMYGNEPAQWDDSLKGADRLRVIVNALTRLRFCTPEGVMDLKASGGLQRRAARLPALVRRAGPQDRGRDDRLRPLVDAGLPAAARHHFAGHRLRLGRLPERAAAGARRRAHELIQVKCEQAQAPGSRMALSPA